MTTGNKTYNRPRPLSDLVHGVTKDVFGRKSALFGKMIAKWPEIAGAEIAACALPLDLKFSRKDNSAVLVLSVLPAQALELSYQKPLLIERLNMFFGYAAIKDIKIVQDDSVMSKNLIKPTKARPLTLPEQQKLETQIAGIQENDLQSALKNLGKAILSRQERPD